MKLREMYDDNNYFAGVSGTKESPDRGMKIHTAMSVRDRRFVELLDVVRNVAKRNNISWKVWLPNEWSSDNLMEGKSVTMYPSTDEETDNPSMASNLNHTMEVAKELDTELFERGIRRIGADIAGTDMEIGNTKDTSESVSIRFGQLSHKDRIYPDGWQDDRSRSMAHNLPRDIDMQQILDAATEQGLELR
jgi:hypothetical protein